MEMTTFSLEGVVSRAMTLLLLKARDKAITLERQLDPEIPDALVGDPLRLEQVLVNLLGNAVKFTDSGTVTLQVSRKPEQATSDRITLEISISDTGIGMDEQTVARLFKPFSQGDTSTTRTHGGTGLGLTICRHLVEMMGGMITVESTPGKGSRFSFTAVFVAGVPTARKSTRSDRGLLVQRYQSLKGLHLLLAEDHPVNRQIAREVLEAVGVQVETADNGREAVAFMHDHGDSIDIILMDIQMPAMDGYEATREIRRRYSRNRLPIIAMTAHALNEERERCLSAGMNDHLAKPIVVEKLYELLARLTDRLPVAGPAGLPTEQSEAFTESFPRQLPGITLETALTRVNGNTRLLAQLIRLFVQEHRHMPDEIRHLLKDNDLASAARLVHGLKGVAGNLSADRLQIAATNLETALKNQDPAAADSLLDLLESALAEVCTSATLLAEPAAHETGSVSGPSADIGALLGELQHLLEIHSLDVNTPLNQLFGLILQGDERIQLEALADAAQRLDYQQALVVLHTLAEKTGACKENL
jgi:CheY-like chemotaxis protein